MNRRKSGQAAMEFLTTYGWAFLIILGSIAALAYFGVINPDVWITPRCVFGDSFSCRDFRILVDLSDAKDYVDFDLINNVGETIDISYLKCTFPTPDTYVCDKAIGCTGEPIPYELPVNWVSGTNQTLRCVGIAGKTGFVDTSKAKVQVELTYVNPVSGFPHTIEGDIIAEVQEIP